MIKQTVVLSPEYCSTGLWLDGANVEPTELGISPSLQLALKYWHEIWEFVISGIDDVRIYL